MRTPIHAAPLWLLCATLAACSAPPSKAPWAPHAEIAGLANGHQEVALYLTEFQRRPTILLECERVVAQPQAEEGVDFTLEGAVTKADWANPQMDAWFDESKNKGASADGSASWFPFVKEVSKTHRMFLQISPRAAGFCTLTSDSGAGFRWSRQTEDHGLEILTGGGS
jgi:hypothetical protein